MTTETGTSRRDRLGGSDQSDTLIGLGGNDVLIGGGGIDFLYGEEMTLYPGTAVGNDRLLGGDGNDFLAGGAGADVLIGGDGDDTLAGGYAVAESEYSFSFAEAGDGGDDSYDGGVGNDFAFIQLERTSDIVVDVSDASVKSAITAGGVTIGTIVSVEQVYVLAGGGDDRLTGGQLGDYLTSRGGDDVLSGGGGGDVLNGGTGDDRLDGGDGIDEVTFRDADAGITVDLRLAGPQDTGQGIDTLIGIERLVGTVFSDRLAGSSGNDRLDGWYGGSDRLSGRGGDDFLATSTSSSDEGTRVVVIGGRGNDNASLSLYSGVDVHARFAGGAGDDQLTLGGYATASVDMGAGMDRIALALNSAAWTVTLGAGSDVVAFTLDDHPYGFITPPRVDDFDAGAGGDRLEFGGLLTSFGSDYVAAENPFATGHLALVRQGEDTALMFDRDGSDGSGTPLTVLILQGIRPGQLDAANLDGFDPAGLG